jgi:hypothetical protein
MTMTNESPRGEQQWFVARDGQRKGPLSSKDLKTAADAGHLDPTDWVWKEGMPKWVPASNVRGLFTDPPPPLMPPAPAFEPVSSATKACPYCGEEILVVAKKCKHCGEFLDGSRQKQGKAIFKASGDFIGLMCSYHVMDARKNVLAKLKPNQSFEVAVLKDTTMYVWYSCGFGGSVEVRCRANEVNRFSVCLSQMGIGCVVSRIDIIDSV